MTRKHSRYVPVRPLPAPLRRRSISISTPTPIPATENSRRRNDFQLPEQTLSQALKSSDSDEELASNQQEVAQRPTQAGDKETRRGSSNSSKPRNVSTAAIVDGVMERHVKELRLLVEKKSEETNKALQEQ